MDQSTLKAIARLKAAAAEYEIRTTQAVVTASDEATAASRRLSAVGEQICSSRGRPVNLADLEDIEPTPPIVRDLMICLRSNDPVVLSTGFFYLNALTLRRPLSSLHADFLSVLRERLYDLLSHPAPYVQSESITWFSLLRDSFADYRERMLQFLSSPEAAVRRAALRWYQSYAKPGEVEPLLSFAEDSFVSEVKPLGPWEYVLRDSAIEMIERHLGQSFPKTRKHIAYEGSIVSWRDWAPFLGWYKNQTLRVAK